MTATEPVNQTPELEQSALTRQEQARAIKIDSQPTLEYAAGELTAIVSLRKEIVEHHEPLKRTTHAAWQAAIAAEKKVLEPVAEAERIIKLEIARYTTEQERIRKEEERRIQFEADRVRREQEAEARRLQEESDRLHAEELEKEIEEAEARGATPEHVAQLASTPPPIVAAPAPVFMPLPVAAATVQKVSGVSMRDVWSAEVTSIRQLAAEVGAGRQPEELLMGLDRNKDTQRVSSPALNKMATALKSALRIPGVRPLNVPAVSARSNR